MLEFYIEYQHKAKTRRDYFGVNELKVVEIVTNVAPVPLNTSTHASIVGTFVLRGKTITLIDFSHLLYKQSIPLERAKIIILEHKNFLFALAVTEISNITNVSCEKIKEAPCLLPLFPVDLLIGIAKHDDRTLYIIKPEALYEIFFATQPSSIQTILNTPILYVDTPYNILIADDSANTRTILNSLFTQLGYTAHLANNGESALTLAQQLYNQNIQLLCFIVDVEMPVFDGYAFAQHIQNTPLHSIPLIFYSSLPLQNHALPTTLYFAKKDLYDLVVFVKSLTE